MKKSIRAGFISELSLAVCALACLVVSAVLGNVGLIIGSSVVMLALLYIAGGFYAEHRQPGCAYFNWVAWFWTVFCVEWTWNTFCKAWTWETFCKTWVWNTFCVEWTWNTFCKAWTWNTFCKAWVWETFCKKWIWQSFCINIVYKTFSKKNETK